MRGGVLEVFLLLPFVGHQSAETFDPFLLTQKVANLVSFKVHDQTNVSQTGTKNISDCTAVPRLLGVKVISPVIRPGLSGRTFLSFLSCPIFPSPG